MKYQLVTTNGETLQKSEMILNEGDKLIITVNHPYPKALVKPEEVARWHEHFKNILEGSNTVITKPSFIDFSVLKITKEGD